MSNNLGFCRLQGEKSMIIRIIRNGFMYTYVL